jgi:hypothetical protein
MGFALSGLGASLGVLWSTMAAAQAAPPTVAGQGPGSAPVGTEAPPAPQPAPLAPLAPLAPSGDFLTLASPFVDFSFTSFSLEARTSNFLNFGIQLGMYAFEHLRLSARLVAPLDDVGDGYRNYDTFSPVFGGSGESFSSVPSRSMSALYGASAGLIVTNSRSFVFGPSLGFLRTDVEDYGTAVVVALPFEWTTQRNLRMGFEFALGHAVGGTARSVCRSGSPVMPCGIKERQRPGGTAVLAQFYMGWALGRM